VRPKRKLPALPANTAAVALAGARAATWAPFIAIRAAALHDGPSSVRLIEIRACPGATADTSGAGGCESATGTASDHDEKRSPNPHAHHFAPIPDDYV
jgi:hypothetical protein